MHGFLYNKWKQNLENQIDIFHYSHSPMILKKKGLVSLFNGILTFVGYLIPKLSSYKNSSGTI